MELLATYKTEGEANCFLDGYAAANEYPKMLARSANTIDFLACRLSIVRFNRWFQIVREWKPDSVLPIKENI